MYSINKFGLELRNLIIGVQSVVDDVFMQEGDIIYLKTDQGSPGKMDVKAQVFKDEKLLFGVIFTSEISDIVFKSLFKNIKAILTCYKPMLIYHQKDTYTSKIFDARFFDTTDFPLAYTNNAGSKISNPGKSFNSC